LDKDFSIKTVILKVCLYFVIFYGHTLVSLKRMTLQPINNYH